MGKLRETTGAEDIRQAVRTADSPSFANRKNGKGRSIDRWIDRLTNELELWHAPDGEAFATIPANGHLENWPIASQGFRRCLMWYISQRSGSIPGKADMEKICDALSARAYYAGPKYDLFTRIGEKNGRVYVDMGDPDWACIEIQPADLDSDELGWCILPNAPVKFVRRRSMLPLVRPVHGGDIDLLHRFLNVETEGDIMLVVGWLLACYRARGPYPILLVNGPQGSGKTIMLELLRRLIDPIVAPARNLPNDERNLFAAARSSHLSTFDNQSTIGSSMSDTLCRLATGGGFSHRALHTNDEEHVIEVTKPILLNSVPELSRRADLADRSIVVRAKKLGPDRRQAVEDLKQAFDADEPRILGALLDAVSYALRTYPDVPVPRIRMVDAGRFMIAGGERFGWERSGFAKLLEANRLEAIETVIDSDPFILALLEFLETEPDWKGSAGKLLAILTGRVDPKATRLPRTPSGMSAALNRAKDALNTRGFDFDRGRDDGPKRERFVQFRRPGPSDQT